MPRTLMQPPAISCATYVMFLGSGLLFLLTEDARSLEVIVGGWAPVVTGMMLIIGGIGGIIGAAWRRFPVELAAFPFLIGVWVVYALSIVARYFEDSTVAIGFAFLLSGGALNLLGRAIELWNGFTVERDLRRRQAERSTTA